jgi:hypothetical protein
MKRILNCLIGLSVLYGFHASAQTIACQPTLSDGNEVVPSIGQVEVGEDSGGRYIWQWMYWHSSDRTAWHRRYHGNTFEPDAWFYNYDGMSYADRPGGYWDSNLPVPYVDTQAFDTNEEKSITIGSADMWFIGATNWYYTVTRFWAGAGNSSWLKLSSQRGVQYPAGCTDTFCSFGCNAPNNWQTLPFSDHFSVPGCRKYWWNYWVTTRGACG